MSHIIDTRLLKFIRFMSISSQVTQMGLENKLNIGVLPKTDRRWPVRNMQPRLILMKLAREEEKREAESQISPSPPPCFSLSPSPFRIYYFRFRNLNPESQIRNPLKDLH
jgi:hypothetical protein